MSTFDPKETILLAQRSSSQQLKEIAEQLSSEQIYFLLKTLNGDDEKTAALLQGLKSRTLLETVGHIISVPQLVQYLITNKEDHWKLSPILVGFTPDLFEELLSNLEFEQLEPLRHASTTEPVHHHLTLLLHSLTAKEADLQKQMTLLERRISLLDITALDRQSIFEMIAAIQNFETVYHHLTEIANKALAIAWHTNRTDLIEGYNEIKDLSQKNLNYRIGTPRIEKNSPTGLYLSLEYKLFFSLDQTKNLSALKNEEPAIEALAFFSIWYLSDYWKLGLLPDVKDAKELGMSLEEEKQAAFFLKAEQTLSSKGLSSVEDLKKNFIFSKKSLQEYLSSNL